MSLIPSMNYTEIVTTVVSDIITHVIIASAVLIFGVIKINKRLSEKRDKQLIYDFLYDKTKHLIRVTVGAPLITFTWPTTVDISAAVDITEERVHHLCTIDKRIQRQEQEDIWPEQEIAEPRWAVREFVRG